MAPLVNESGHPPDVTALTVTKETDVTRAQRGSREMAAQTFLRGSKGMDVIDVLMVTMVTRVVSRF